MGFGIGKDFEKNLGKDISSLDITNPNTQQQNEPGQSIEPIKQADPPADPPKQMDPPADPPKQQDPSKDSMGFTKINQDPPADPPKTTDTVTEEAVLNFLKSKGKEVKSFEELFAEKEKEVVKEINPYEDILDEEDKAYLNYKKETGRNRKDWDALNKDISGIPTIELARERVRQETGMPLSNEEADEYLEATLSITIGEELDTVDKIKLNGYSKPYKDKLIEEQNKYKKPIDKTDKVQSGEISDNMIKLQDGTVMAKEVYDQKIKERDSYVRDMTNAVNSVAALDFKVTIDDNGEKSELNISYELSKEDKQSMLSDVLDVDAMIARNFKTENGFNHSEFRDTVFRGNKKNFDNILNAVAQRVRAATIQEMIANSNNLNFKQQPLQRQSTGNDGYGSLTTGNQKNGFGVKFSGFEKA